MSPVGPCEVPNPSLLQVVRDAGAYADCYVTEVEREVALPAFVEAFYTTRLFRLERALLRWFAARPSSDLDARRLAEGVSDSFAAWHVEGRTTDQLLLADFTGRTKSWLMVAPVAVSGARTRLYFGSAVVRSAGKGTGRSGLGRAFHALLGLHRIYSRLLLGAARSRFQRSP